MKRLLYALAILGVIYAGATKFGESFELTQSSSTGNEQIASAFNNQTSGLQVSGEGVVSRLLPDDNDGSAHQRFILTLASGQTLLISHNIDLAPRVASLGVGDTVAFHGEYEWNSKGGVIHWTHHDPRGEHPAGWLKHGGRTYQ